MKEKNIETPGIRSIQIFENGLKSHNRIVDFSKKGYVYNIKRNGGLGDLKIMVADVYIMSEADFLEILNEESDLNGIVLIGFMNMYTDEAKVLSKTHEVGLHGPRDFYGALHKDGLEFVDYEWKPKKKNKKDNE